MGSNSSSNPGNDGADAFVNKKSKVKKVKRDKFGYTKKTNKVVDYISGGGIIGRVTKPIREKTEQVNRDYYNTKVKKYSGNTKGTYEEYIRARGRGEVDAMGRPISQGDNGGAIGTSGQVVQAPTVTAPTTAEVSQTTTAEAKEDDILLRKRKAKAKGRSPTIMTGVTGATGSLTLGKPSLLGS